MRLFSIFLIALCLAGCGLVYKQNIQQGNVLNDEDLEQLSEGLTKRQVLVLLGSPSVQSPFHADRWDYVSTFSRRGGKPHKRKLTLHFDDDRLVEVSGNYLDHEELTLAAIENVRAMGEEVEARPAQPQPIPGPQPSP